MLKRVVSAYLGKPPQMMRDLASAGGLLVAWHSSGMINDDTGMEYHFAIHFQEAGWHGYRLDEEYSKPVKILPGSTNTLWINTQDGHLIHLRVVSGAELTVVANLKAYWLLYADNARCLLQTTSGTVLCLYTHTNMLHETMSEFEIPFLAKWAHPLSDGAMVVGNASEIAVFSGSAMIYREKRTARVFSYYAPFIVCCDKTGFYYTADPRTGWHNTNVMNAHQKRINAYDGHPIFFTIVENTCCAAIQMGYSTALYSFPENSPADVQYVGTCGTAFMYASSIARYNELVCMTGITYAPFDTSAKQARPTNGFLAWDPLRATFYADIPRRMEIAKRLATQIPDIRIPSIWRNDARQHGAHDGVANCSHQNAIICPQQ